MQRIPDAFTEAPIRAEKQQVKRDANFVGGLLLALLAGQLLISILIGVATVCGLLDMQREDYGLGNTALVLMNMLAYMLYLVVPTLLTVLISHRTQVPFPRKRVAKGTYALALFGGMAMAVLANFAASYLMAFFTELGVPYPEFTDTVEPTIFSLLLNCLSTAVLPALVEEWIFRGYILGALRPHGEKLAIVFTAVLFGLIHGNLLQFPFALILGLVLGWLTVQTGSLLPAVLLHFTNNLVSVLLSWCELYLPEGTPLTELLFLLFCVAGALSFAAAYAARRDHRTDILRRVGNGVSVLTVAERVKSMVTAPAMLVGGAAWIVILIVASWA